MNTPQEIATRITIAWLNTYGVVTKELGHVEQHIPTPEEVCKFFLAIHNCAQETSRT